MDSRLRGNDSVEVQPLNFGTDLAFRGAASG
jgi:hypothetical protein